MIPALGSWARAHPRWVAGLRVLTSVALLVLMLAWIDLRELKAALAGADGAWLALALLLSVPQLLLVAWRWSFTARRMGLPLPLWVAWREYYVATLLNSVLPGGVAGDVVKVKRQVHGPERSLGLVARSVVVERAAGQVVKWLALLVGAAAWGLGDLLVAALGTLAVVAVVGAAILWIGRRWLEQLRQELRAALLERGALWVQLSTSLLSLLALVAMFHACALAVGSALSVAQALVLVPWILMAAVLPLSVGGWGVRELSAAALFPLAGLPAAEGAASAVLYGAVSLVSALPGLVPLARARRGRPR